MSRRCSLQTVLVVLVTSVAANHEGAYCDCSSQGRWQPLFKPSQILHSEFPEHKYSDSTGGPRPAKLHAVKMLPHLVVPLINPLAISIQHHQHKGEHEYEELNGNSIEEDVERGKKQKNKLKNEHFDYNYPYYNAPSYDEETTSTHRPDDDGHSFEEHYQNDSHEQGEHFNDTPHHPEDNAEDVSTEAGHTSAEDYTRGYDPVGSSGPGPEPTYSTNDEYYGDGYHYNNNHDESSTPSPYYNSEEQKEPVYDSSKYSPSYNSHNGYIHKGIKSSGSKKHIYRDVNNYYGIDTRGKSHGLNTRGKSLRYPSSNSHTPDGALRSSPPHKHKHPKRVKRPPKSLASRPKVPKTLHSDLYHPPPPPPPPPPSVASPTPTRVAPDRTPIYHAHPPLAIITPLKLILREEAKRITLLRPPAPGIHHTWTFDTPLTSRSNEIALLKKPRVLYVMKTVPHDSLSLIK